MYWAASPITYTPNPAQLTAPLHGVLLGLVAYNTVTPPSSYDGIRIDTPVGLKGIKELYLTTETAALDQVTAVPHGPVFLDGEPNRGGRDVVHFDLRGPTASGSAALLTNLDEDPVQF